MNTTRKAVIPEAPFYVFAIDTFMSGWGDADGMVNAVVLPCKDRDQAEIVANNAQCRSDMRRILVCEGKAQIPSRAKLPKDNRSFSAAFVAPVIGDVQIQQNTSNKILYSVHEDYNCWYTEDYGHWNWCNGKKRDFQCSKCGWIERTTLKKLEETWNTRHRVCPKCMPTVDEDGWDIT